MDTFYKLIVNCRLTGSIYARGFLGAERKSVQVRANMRNSNPERSKRESKTLKKCGRLSANYSAQYPTCFQVTTRKHKRVKVDNTASAFLR